MDVAPGFIISRESYCGTSQNRQEMRNRLQVLLLNNRSLGL